MNLLDAFDDADRKKLLSASDVVNLTPGNFLLRRGEAGGDLYFVEAGRLDVVDTRQTPEVILSAISAGDLVGEMSFLDLSPRSADVRAAVPTRVRRWTHDDLHALVAKNPSVAASLYRVIAHLTSNRVRLMTEGATVGAFGARSTSQLDDTRAAEAARAVADRTKAAFIDLEVRSRGDRRQLDQVTRDVRATLDALEDETRSLFTTFPDANAGQTAAATLGRELRPFLGRSALADKCLRRPQGYAASADILAHTLANSAAGDGMFGEIVDRWLLDRPTLGALRAARKPILGLANKVLPTQRPNVLVVNAGAGALASALGVSLADREATLSVLDQSHDALAFMENEETTTGAEMLPLVENLPAFATGRGRQRVLPQDLVIVDGLLEYLPERIASALVGVLRSVLKPNGTIVLSTLSPSADRDVLDHVFNWPTLRRTRSGVQGILVSAGLQVAGVFEPGGPSLIAAGRAPA